MAGLYASLVVFVLNGMCNIDNFLACCEGEYDRHHNNWVGGMIEFVPCDSVIIL